METDTNRPLEQEFFDFLKEHEMLDLYIEANKNDNEGVFDLGVRPWYYICFEDWNSKYQSLCHLDCKWEEYIKTNHPEYAPF